ESGSTLSTGADSAGDHSAAGRAALARVLWIGGACDAGKTSVTRVLAERYGLQPYHYDRFDRLTPPGHWTRIDPARHPHMHFLRERVDDLEARWVETTPE